MVNDALFAPAVVGANVTATVVAAPTASAVVPGAPTVYCDAPAPAIANGGVSVTGDNADVGDRDRSNRTSSPTVTLAKVQGASASPRPHDAPVTTMSESERGRI